MLLGAEVTIGAPEGELYGIVACKPPHLLAANESDKAVPIHEMVIDTGLLDAKSRIPVGTPIWFPADKAHMPKLSKDSITGPSLDDRAGAAAIAYALQKLRKVDLAVDVAVLLSVQEEVTSLVRRLAPSTSDRITPSRSMSATPKTPDASDQFEYGGGVMIGMGPNMNRALTRALIRTAKAEDMDYQIEVMEGNTGTNAWEMQIIGTVLHRLSCPSRCDICTRLLRPSSCPMPSRSVI